MAQNYECALLINPNLADEAVQQYLDDFSKQITDRGGEVVHIQKWGKRSLEYPIGGHKEAYYAFLCFRIEAAGNLITELERLVRINEDLLREMTVKVPELKITPPPNSTSRFSESARLSYAAGRRSGGFRGGPRGAARPQVVETGESTGDEEKTTPPDAAAEKPSNLSETEPASPADQDTGGMDKAPEA